jgi:hypothetical protein
MMCNYGWLETPLMTEVTSYEIPCFSALSTQQQRIEEVGTLISSQLALLI